MFGSRSSELNSPHLKVLVNVSSLAPPPSLSQSKRASVRPSVRPSVCHKTPHPGKRLGHKTRDPNPKKGSVTKLETPTRKKGRSQNSRPHNSRIHAASGE